MPGRLIAFVLGTAAVFGALLWLSGRGDESTSKATDAVRAPTPQDYLDHGVPPPDRVWTGKDYAAALAGLQKMSSNNPATLPRYQHKTTGALFARMTSPENFEFLSDTKLPLAQRLPASLDLQPPVTNLARLYMKSGPRRFENELTEVVAHQLELSVLMNRLALQFKDELPPNDPKYAVRMEGLEKMRRGWAMMVTGLFVTFTETHVYSSSTLTRLARHAQRTLPELFFTLPAATQTEYRRQLSTIISDTKNAGLKSALAELMDALSTPQTRTK